MSSFYTFREYRGENEGCDISDDVFEKNENKNKPGGYPGLDINSKIDGAQLPPMALETLSDTQISKSANLDILAFDGKNWVNELTLRTLKIVPLDKTSLLELSDGLVYELTSDRLTLKLPTDGTSIWILNPNRYYYTIIGSLNGGAHPKLKLCSRFELLMFSPHTNSWTVTVFKGYLPPSNILSDFDYYAMSIYLREKKPVVETHFFEVKSNYSGDSTNAAYSGGVYDPLNKRIVFAPASAMSAEDFVFIDCTSDKIQKYTAPPNFPTADIIDDDSNYELTIPINPDAPDELSGKFAINPPPKSCTCFYDPINRCIMLLVDNRLFCLDCTNSDYVWKELPTTASFIKDGYMGSAYDPEHRRVYLAPYNQGPESTLHFWDCGTSTLKTYENNAQSEFHLAGYGGAVYAPTLKRVYFAPRDPSKHELLHYIDCSSNKISSYKRPRSMISGCAGAVFSPVENFIYFIPHSYFKGWMNMFVLDCNNDTFKTISVPNFGAPSISGVYSPLTNRIYLTPNTSLTISKIMYVDCNQFKVFNMPLHSPISIKASYGVFNPISGTVYFTPFRSETDLFSIGEETDQKIDEAFIAHAQFNKNH